VDNWLPFPTIFLIHYFLLSYLSIYGLILLVATIAYSTASGVYVFGALRASRIIHAKLIEAVLGTTLRYVPIRIGISKSSIIPSTFLDG
jgi:hypothetical protein